LGRPMDDASLHESKLRRQVAAFACWWDSRPYDCYLQLAELADAYPDDLDLQIETARLAIVNLRSTKAFQRLDAVTPLDEQTRIQLQIARIILAAEAGKDEMVRTSARELLAGSIDASTRDFVSKKLQSLNKQSPAIESVGRAFSSTRRIQLTPRVTDLNDTQNLALAKSMLDSGESVTASEIAYSILIRRQNASKIDRSSIRRQAIDILIRTGRLQPLITTTERKFQSSPQSDAYRQELADLYVAAGQPEKASQLWEQTISAMNMSPRQIIMQASTLRGRRDFHHAAMLYLYAFERDPQLWETHWNVFAGSAAMSTSPEIIFDRLSRMDLSPFTPFSLCELIRIHRDGQFGPAQRAFARHIIGNHPQAAENLDLFFAAIPKSERTQIPELTAKLTDAITSDDAFTYDSPLWALRGWSEQGRVSGLFADMMEIIENDPELKNRFLAVVDAQPNRSQPTAQLLKAVCQLRDPEHRDAAVAVIDKLCPSALDVENAIPPISRLPAGLLWQIGQSIDLFDPIDQPGMLKVGIYQAAIRESGDRLHSSAGVGLPSDWLLAEYARIGQKQLARRGWLARLEHDVTPKTTGIRENRYLQTATLVSENLLKIGYPVDAAGQCRHCINQPLLFHLARRYSQGRDHQEHFETTFKKAIDSINDQSVADYFDAITNDIAFDGHQTTIDLYATQLKTLSDTPNDCLFELAAEIACVSESGRAAAERLFQQLDRVAERKDANTSIRHARLILASRLHPKRVNTMLETFLESLPPSRSGHSTSGAAKTALVNATRISYFAIAAVTRSQIDEAASVTERVLRRLQQNAIDSGDSELELALKKLSRSPESMSAVLESVVEELGGQAPSPQDCDRCLSIARSAAAIRRWDIVARALEVGLGRGPNIDSDPGSTVNTEVADEFGGEAATGEMSSIEVRLAAIREQVLAVLDGCRDKNGVPISAPIFDANNIDLDIDSLKPLDRALLQVVFPKQQFVNVYAFSRPALLAEPNSRKPTLADPHSVAYAAANIARVCGTTDSLIKIIGERMNASNAVEVRTLYVDLAVAIGDDKTLADAVDHFKSAFDDRLPWVDGVVPAASQKSGDAQPAGIKKPIPPHGTEPVLILADQVIRTLHPVLNRKSLAPSTRTETVRLMMRTIQMMRDNEIVRNRFGETIDQIESLCK
ncbi:MAG: hypothetical protein KDB00_27225, partial [Planctomycetales bacterium]|nr:hypothetical protein [Planctomycetales bacterium]